MNAVLWFRRSRGRAGAAPVGVPADAHGVGVLCSAAVGDAAVDERALQITPPRLGFVEGDVSFWRPGAGDWEAAQVNLPLAPGDALATQRRQARGADRRAARSCAPPTTRSCGSRARSRTSSSSRSRAGQRHDRLRELQARAPCCRSTRRTRTMTMARDGYYRVDVGAASDPRRSCAAPARPAVTPAGGQRGRGGAPASRSSIEGSAGGQLTVGAAPGFDDWDRWSYDRADRLPRRAALVQRCRPTSTAPRSSSARELALRQHVRPRLGPVRRCRPAGRPYTYGRWLYDPFYGWSWVDYAPVGLGAVPLRPLGLRRLLGLGAGAGRGGASLRAGAGGLLRRSGLLGRHRPPVRELGRRSAGASR